MIYCEMTDAQREQAEEIAWREIERLVGGNGRIAHITIDRVIRVYTRYKVRGRVYVEGDKGYLSEDYRPWFAVVFEAPEGLDGKVTFESVHVATVKGIENA